MIYYIFRNLNKLDDSHSDSLYVHEKQTISYKGKIRYKERNFTTDYSMATEYLKVWNKEFNKVNGSTVSETTKKNSQSGRSNIDFRVAIPKKGLTIRIGTPVREVKKKDLPSPSLGFNPAENVDDKDTQLNALGIIKRRISQAKPQVSPQKRAESTLPSPGRSKYKLLDDNLSPRVSASDKIGNRDRNFNLLNLFQVLKRRQGFITKGIHIQ